jgi:hypothetical protein
MWFCGTYNNKIVIEIQLVFFTIFSYNILYINVNKIAAMRELVNVLKLWCQLLCTLTYNIIKIR